MSDIVFDTQSAPATPSNGQCGLWPDNQAKRWFAKNADGDVLGSISRASVAQQSGFATDAYLINSGLIIPSTSMVVGMSWIWDIIATKTAAGTIAPIFTVRVGSAQSVADTARLAITTAAQTAAIDTARITVMITCRSVGASGILQGSVHIQHNLAATGFANTPAGFNLVQGASAGFDNTALGGQFVGLSINGGTNAVWTIEQVLSHCRFN